MCVFPSVVHSCVDVSMCCVPHSVSHDLFVSLNNTMKCCCFQRLAAGSRNACARPRARPLTHTHWVLRPLIHTSCESAPMCPWGPLMEWHFHQATHKTNGCDYFCLFEVNHFRWTNNYIVCSHHDPTAAPQTPSQTPWLLDTTVVMVLFLYPTLPCDHRHPLVSPGNNWTHVLRPRPRVLFWICNIVQAPLPSALSGRDLPTWFMSRGDFDGSSGLSPRKGERDIFASCLRSLLTVSSSHLSMVTAIWSYYLSGCDTFMFCVHRPHWAFCVEQRKVCSVWDSTGQGLQRVIGWFRCGRKTKAVGCTCGAVPSVRQRKSINVLSLTLFLLKIPELLVQFPVFRHVILWLSCIGRLDQ